MGSGPQSETAREEGSFPSPMLETAPDATVRAAIELVLSDVGDAAVRKALQGLFDMSGADAVNTLEAALDWIAKREHASPGQGKPMTQAGE